MLYVHKIEQQTELFILGTANQLAFGDGVHIVDDHLEVGGTLLELGPLFQLGDMSALDVVVEGQVAEAEEADGAFVVAGGQSGAAVIVLGEQGTSMTPAATAATADFSKSLPPSSRVLFRMARVSFMIMCFSAMARGPFFMVWQESMLASCFVARRPAALASLVGMPKAS